MRDKDFTKQNFYKGCIKAGEMMIGIAFLGIGSSLGIIANVGQTTSTSTFSAMSGTMHIKVGTAMFLVYVLFLVLQVLLMGKDFKLLSLCQIIPSAIKGRVLNFFRYEFIPFQMLNPVTYQEKAIMFVIGAVFISFGFAATKCSNFLNYPPESFCSMVADKTKIRFGTCKFLLDIIYVASTIVICYMGHLGWGIVREGTIIFALINGPLINFFSPYIRKAYDAAEKILENIFPKLLGQKSISL